MLFNVSVKQGENEYHFGIESEISRFQDDLNAVFTFIMKAYKISDKDLDINYSINECNLFSHTFKVKDKYTIIINSELGLADLILGNNNYLVRAAAPNINAKDRNVIRAEF